MSNPQFMLGDALLEQIRRTKATGFGGVPAHYVRIADVATEPVDCDLRFLMNSGDHLPINVLRQLIEVFPDADIFCAYGISECAPRVCCLPPELLREKMGSVGPPLPSTSVSIRDENCQPLPVGELGEVYVRSVCLMKEYYANAQATRKSMSEHGFRTGDMGYLDADGCLFLTGRNDSVFKSAGEKVSCRYIEETVRDSSLFSALMSDVVVLAVDDHYLGKVPCLYYTRGTGDNPSLSAMKRELRKKLPRNHIPAKYIEVKEVSRSPSGKVIKSALQSPDNVV